jgi:cob(I)alamin adenosyltransferase
VTDRIYTRTGDAGTTALFGGGRTSKADARVDAYGAVDELNASLGWAHAVVADEQVRAALELVQADMLTIGAHLATPPAREGRRAPALPALPVERVAEMESWIDDADAELPALTAFILPGGTDGAAALHVARTVCRRAERRVVSLAAASPVDGQLIVYLNRLSDWLFTAARLVNARAGGKDRVWLGNRGAGP